jgi:hypothetical protein
MVGQPPFQAAVSRLPLLALAVGACLAGNVGSFKPPFEMVVGGHLPPVPKPCHRHFKRRLETISTIVESNYLFW